MLLPEINKLPVGSSIDQLTGWLVVSWAWVPGIPEVAVVINAPLTALSITKKVPLGENTPGAEADTALTIARDPV